MAMVSKKIKTETIKSGKQTEANRLFGEIKRFFEEKGIHVYRMQVEVEAYQVKHNGEIIRFYVQRTHSKG